MRKMITALALPTALLLSFDSFAHALTFEEAQARVLEKSPAIHVAERLVEIRDAEVWQSSLWYNPVLEFGVENIGQKCDDNTTQVSVGLGQVFEMGGKRARRVEVAEANMAVAWWDLEIQRQDKLQDLAIAFIETAVSQERLHLAEAQLNIAEQALSSIKAKVDNGKTSSMELKKHQIARQTALLNLNKIRITLEANRNRLALMWGDQTPDFETVAFDIFDKDELPPIAELQTRLIYSPELERARAVTTRSYLTSAYEKAQGVPNLSLSAGVSQYTDPGCTTGFFGFSIPLPFVDRNQGNILRSELEWSQSLDNYFSLEIGARERLQMAYRSLAIAAVALKELNETILVLAEDSYNQADEGYHEGKFEYLDMLEAWRTLKTFQQEHLDMVLEYHYRQIELMRILGDLWQCKI